MAQGAAVNKPAVVLTYAQKASSSNGIRCFTCSEVGHRQAECRKNGKKVMFVETDEQDDGENDADLTSDPIFDTDHIDEEVVTGDMGTTLVERRSYLTPRAVNDDLAVK